MRSVVCVAHLREAAPAAFLRHFLCPSGRPVPTVRSAYSANSISGTPSPPPAPLPQTRPHARPLLSSISLCPLSYTHKKGFCAGHTRIWGFTVPRQSPAPTPTPTRHTRPDGLVVCPPRVLRVLGLARRLGGKSNGLESPRAGSDSPVMKRPCAWATDGGCHLAPGACAERMRG